MPRHRSVRTDGRPWGTGSAEIGALRQRRLIETVHNYGTENDPKYYVNNRNMEHSMGFTYISTIVSNLQAACQRLKKEGFTEQKLADANLRTLLTDGRMGNVAFLLDPDGYWVKMV
ncbi:hypothetical protein BKA56DRAFT_486469 [Ilyonectria sp. MPI-CAGE-AT-0026]|nr:hypothetical protein BKA56DRAFT_486469 [Ilyonectria sp. MPI-CAGE-AT-0026]